MESPKSRMIPLLCIVYGLIATAGLYLAVLGQKIKPDSLPLIDETGKQSVRLEQARQMAEQARQQQPSYMIITTFYKGWLLESDYEILSTPTHPLHNSDRVEQGLDGLNDTAREVDAMYLDAIYTLAFLSSGSLILVMIMLWTPSYLVAILLATYPFVVLFLCALFEINHDPLGYCLVPFIVLGGMIFVFQLVFSFRFGRPEHRTAEGTPGLMIYRRGLLLLNLGIFMLVSASMMASGSLSGTSHSVRARLGLALFGEGGITFIGFVVGVLLITSGVYYLRRPKSTDVI